MADADVRGARVLSGPSLPSRGASPDRARRLASALRIGIVGINNGAPNNPRVPFGGFGASGLGREVGLSGLLEFTGEQTLSEAV